MRAIRGQSLLLFQTLILRPEKATLITIMMLDSMRNTSTIWKCRWMMFHIAACIRAIRLRERVFCIIQQDSRDISEDCRTESGFCLAICDTKDTGTDYNFLGVFYQYGDRYYLEDLVFKNIDPGTLDELNSDMLVKHHVQQAQFESNKEGSRTANEVERLVKAKGGRCHITKKYTTQNKETKIIVNSSWVKEHVIFKDITEYEPKSDYGVMMSFLCSYTQLGKNKHDDAPDTLAMFAQFVDALLGGEGQVVKRSDLGI